MESTKEFQICFKATIKFCKTIKFYVYLTQMNKKILNECFKFDSHKGVVNAKSKKKVSITFKPNQRFEIETSLVCIAKEKMTKELGQSMRLQ